MKTIKALILLISLNTSAKMYKYPKKSHKQMVYQAKPCAVDSDQGKMDIKLKDDVKNAKFEANRMRVEQTAAAERMERDRVKKENFELYSKAATLEMLRQDVDAQHRQADAQEEQARKPPALIIAPQGVYAPR